MEKKPAHGKVNLGTAHKNKIFNLFPTLFILLILLIIGLIYIKNTQILTGRATNQNSFLLRSAGNPGETCSGELIKNSTNGSINYLCREDSVCYSKAKFVTDSRGITLYKSDSNSEFIPIYAGANNPAICYYKSATGPYEEKYKEFTFDNICGKEIGSPCCPKSDIPAKDVRKECIPGLVCDNSALAKHQSSPYSNKEAFYNPWYYRLLDARIPNISNGLCIPFSPAPTSSLTCGETGNTCCPGSSVQGFCDNPSDQCLSCSAGNCRDQNQNNKCLGPSEVGYTAFYYWTPIDKATDKDIDIIIGAGASDRQRLTKNLFNQPLTQETINPIFVVTAGTKLNIYTHDNTKTRRSYYVRYSCNDPIIGFSDMPYDGVNFSIECGPYKDSDVGHNFTLTLHLF